ncbi:MAG: ArnT family glycosyltransferase [Chloroflexota bacterium]
MNTSDRSTALSQRQQLLILSLLLVVIWAVWTLRLSEPYYGVRDNLEIWIPSAVRNLAWYGPAELGYLVTTTAHRVDELEALRVYTHHPPLVAWLPYLWTRLAGFNELAVRSVFAAFMLLAAVGFYVTARRLYGARLALWALAIFAFTPMIAYYGTGHNHDPLGFGASMLFAAVFVNWLRRPGRARYAALSALAVLAAWTAWPAVFMVAAFGVWGLFAGDARQRVGIFLLGAVTALAAAGVLIFYEAQHPGAVNSLMDAFLWRTSSASLRRGSEAFTIIGWVATNLSHIVVFGTIGVLLLAVIGAKPFWRKASPQGRGALLALAGGAITYWLVFRNAAYIHDYYKTWAMPALALLAAAAVWTSLPVRPRSRRQRRLRAVVVSLGAIAIVQAVAVMALFMFAFHQPALDRTIAYVNANIPADAPLLISNADWTTKWGFDRVIAFYTGRPIFLNESVEALEARGLRDFTHIDCTSSADPAAIRETVAFNCVLVDR